jgi:nucleotide-binding universal stress UspA family protein
MFERILVPLDGSQSGEVVLRFLRRLPLHAGARILLARIVEPGPKDPGPGFVEESLEFAASYLRDVAEGLRRAEVVVETTARYGRVAETLVSIAAEERASLIALATHGRTASADLPYGGVADQLLRTSPVPMLAVPSLSRPAFGVGAGTTGLPVRTLLVTTDGSDCGNAIFPVASRLAAAGGISVILLQLSPGRGRSSGTFRRRTDVEEHLERAARTFRRKGIPTECVTGRASPARGILEVAEQRKVDLIAMSTHGESRRRVGAVGSVTREVLHQGGIPVLVTRVSPVASRVQRPGRAARAHKSGSGHRSS